MKNHEIAPNGPEGHISQIVNDLSFEVQKKYQIGQKEHGGKLWRKPVLDFAWEEVLDLPVYLHVLKHQSHAMTKIAVRGMEDGNPVEALREIFNILTIGNAEGVVEEGD